MIIRILAAAATAALFAGSSQASVTVYNTEAAFLTAAGTTVTETFETQALGYYSPIAIVGGSISFATPNYGSGFSGVTDQSFGSIYGFNTTLGGSKWFGFPNSGPAVATFSFTAPTNSFGFYSTGVQTTFTSVFKVTQLDGSATIFNLPITVNGGSSYFGVVDTTGFTSVEIYLSSTGDAWGIDDVSYNNAVPEPASWALMIAGFGLVGAAMRRRSAALAA